MARNQVQFQKGLSEAAFDEAYGTEEQCHAALVAWRWPEGFECPDCLGRRHCVVSRGTRRLFPCNACRKQTSVRAGTIFASSKLPLRLWFKTLYHLTQSKNGVSSLELARRLGVTQTAAWMMKHKLGQVMLERNASKRLTGKIQMDDAYIGRAHSGRRGRGAKGKTPFVAAVATTDDGKPDQIILRRVPAFRKVAIRNLSSTGDPRRSRGRLRRTGLFPGCVGAWLHSRGHQDRKRSEGCKDAGLQGGQHRARQHQGRARGNLPRRARETCVPVSRRIRIPLQSKVRPLRNDPAPRLRRPADPADAIPPPEAG